MLWHGDYIAALEPNCAAHDPPWRPDHAQYRQSGYRLSGSRLTDETDDLACFDGEADPVNRLYRTVIGVEMHGEIFDRQQTYRTPRMRGSMMSRKASPMRLNDSTAIMIASPWKTNSHHSPVTIWLAPSAVISPHSLVGG